MNRVTMNRTFAAFLLAAMTAGLAQGQDNLPLLATDQGDRVSVDVTVYNQNLALVRELRTVDFPGGEVVLEFRDVPSAINPVTLLVSEGGDLGLGLFEQNYEFDLMSRDKILQKYVGKGVGWIKEDGSRVEGTLLSMNAGPVFLVDGEIVFEVPGRIVLPSLPGNLRARPTLVWKAATGQSGRTTLETSYLSGGMSWNADYVLQLNGKGDEGGLQAWVSVDNRSGGSFRDAKLLLIAGDINRAPPSRNEMMDFRTKSMAASSAPQFSEETLYDYHLYTLDRKTDILDQQIKQISLFETAGIQLVRHYRLKAGPQVFRGLGYMQAEQKIEVSYSFQNSAGNNMGMPLPAGVFRIYGRSAAGGRQLLGEDRIDHTPKDERVELRVGKAFDVVAERTRDESRKIADNLYRASFTISLRNHKAEDIVVDISEPVGGDWSVLESSHEARRVSSSELAFQVPVKAGGKAELKYRIEYKY